MKPLTFLHSADWQLGKPFARVPDPAKRARLQQERFHAIERLRSIVVEQAASFVLVAGDLFDSPSVTQSVVSQACSLIGQLGVPVYVIPGNHDPGGPGSLWESEFFLRERGQLAANLHILLRPEPIVLESAVLLPCPLLRKHESSDPTQWLWSLASTENTGREWGARSRIILAHGSTADFGEGGDDEESDSQPNRINLERLSFDQFDYAALGDWHGTKQVHPHAWYSGTPELDRFPKGDGHDPGNVLVVTTERGKPPQVRKQRVAQFGWHKHSFDFSGDSDPSLLEHQLADLLGGRAASDLLELTLEGQIFIGARARLDAILESYEARLIRLKLRDGTRIAPSPDEIDALTRRAGDPLISSVALRLTEIASGTGDEAALAQRALCELHNQISNA
jgi:DNA repair exonuclease SbcCD nuclease subunit